MLAGGPIEPGRRIEGARLIDVAPTVLHLLDLPVPSDMDGTVLTGALRDAYLRAHPVRHETVSGGDAGGSPEGGYTREEAEVMEDRLKALGYLE